jgi:hypothetical protein
MPRTPCRHAKTPALHLAGERAISAAPALVECAGPDCAMIGLASVDVHDAFGIPD